jgi:hypothetical protein
VVILPGGWVRRQLCEPLSALFQAVVYLPHTVSRLLLQALFTALHSGKLSYLHSLAGFVCSEFWMPAPSLFSSVKSYQAVTAAGLVYLEFVSSTVHLPFSCRVSHMSGTVASLPHSKLAGGPPNPPSPAGLFIYSSQGKCSSPFLWHSGCPVLFATCPFWLFIIQYFLFWFVFFCGAGVSLCSHGAVLVYPRGGCGSTTCSLFTHLLICISQAG